MADQKALSLLFKIQREANLSKIRAIIEDETGENTIWVFQEIGPLECRVELSDSQHEQYLIENGFNTAMQHYRCHPPQRLYLNVSILGQKK